MRLTYKLVVHSFGNHWSEEVRPDMFLDMGLKFVTHLVHTAFRWVKWRMGIGVEMNTEFMLWATVHHPSSTKSGLSKGAGERGTMLLLQELFQNRGLLDRNTQNYWIGNRTLRASLCCSCDPSLLDKIWFSSAEWVQTALMLRHKLIISKWKVLSALGVIVWHSQLGTIEA